MICGIYSSVDEFKKHRNTIEYLTYSYDNGRQFMSYSSDSKGNKLVLINKSATQFDDRADLLIPESIGETLDYCIN